MIGRILVPLDGSKLSEEVLPLAESLARQLGAEVSFLRVVDEEWPKTGLAATSWESGLPTVSKKQEEEATSYLGQLAESWRGKGIRATSEVVAGLAGTAIVAYAHSQKIDMIAMCTHGRSGLGRLVFGSVADDVLRRVGIPVLLFKPEHVVSELKDKPAA